MVPVEPESGDDSSFLVFVVLHKIYNELFDTLDTSLVKSKKSALK